MDETALLDEGLVILAAGRVLEAVADGQVLVGTLDAVSQQIGVGTQEVRAALRELRRAGWVAIQTHPGDRLTVRTERRALGRRGTSAVERRQRRDDAWPL